MIPISSIVVKDRQRTDLALDETFIASVAKRLIHPIVLRREDDTTVLVAGGKRLAALEKSGLTDLVENIHFRYMDDLSPTEAQVVELEENVKRSDLSWRDKTSAIGKIHNIYVSQDPTWSIRKTAAELNLSYKTLTTQLVVFKNLASPLLREAQNFDQAYSILENAAARAAANIVNEIGSAGSAIFGTGNTNENPLAGNLAPNSSTIVPTRSDVDIQPDSSSVDGSSDLAITIIANLPALPAKPKEEGPILVADFTEWIKTYTGPKFTLIHCDFPFGIGVFDGTGMKPVSTGEEYDDDSGSDIFFTLLESLLINLDRIASYSSHLMLWFSMNHYERLRQRLLDANLFVLNHPFVWHKTDNTGMVPGRGNHPRRIYETAMLASRGQRPLIKKTGNAYGAPTAANSIHPSQKPEPVLHHFFSMLVDDTTDVFDPTAGSGTSLRAAEFCGARSVLGLELNPRFAGAANTATLVARNLRERAKL